MDDNRRYHKTNQGSLNPGVNNSDLSDDSWDSDFEETNEELYSQEIEDNIRNETREAKLKASAVPVEARNVSEDSRTISPAITENTYSNVSSSTGAISKRGFSYLDNSNVISKNKSRENVILQQIGNPFTDHRNPQDALHVNKKAPVKRDFPPANGLNEETKQILGITFDDREDPRTSKGEAIRNQNNSGKPIRKLFCSISSKSNNQNHLRFHTNKSISHKNEIITTFPSAPPFIVTDNYEQIQDEVKNLTRQTSKIQEEIILKTNNLNEKDRPPPLPSRPPPLPSRPPPPFRQASGEFSKAQTPTNNFKLFKKCANLPASQLIVRLPEFNTPTFDEKTSKNKKVIGEQKTSLEKTKSQTKPPIFKKTPDILSRPLPPTPTSNELNFKDDLFNASVKQCGIPSLRNLATVNSISSTQAAVSSIVQPFHQSSLAEGDKPFSYLQKSVGEIQTSKESQSLYSKKIPQEQLVGTIGNQSNVSLEVLQSQHNIPTILTSVDILPDAEKKIISSTNNDSYENPIHITKDGKIFNQCHSVSHTNRDECGTEGLEETEKAGLHSTQTSVYPSFQKISQVEDSVSYPQIVNETQNSRASKSLDKKETPQQRLAQRLAKVISNQTTVSAPILHSQHKVSSAIASKIADLQKDSIRATNNDSSEKPVHDIEGDTSCPENLQRSRKSIAGVPKPSVPDRRPSNLTMKENTNQFPFTDLEALHDTISRPCLPEKLKTTQRSVSCSSLVQSFKDLSFSIWNSPDKNRRVSAGSNNMERATKDLTKENTVFSTSVPDVPEETASSIKTNVVPSIPATTAVSSENFPNISSQKNTLFHNAWYHEVDAWEAKRRLTFFLDQDGAFLIRPSTRKTNEIQYTACVVFSGRIINMHIRQKPNGEYAIGNEKEGEKTFLLLSDLIKYHQEIPVEAQTSLQPFSNLKPLSTCLRVTPPKI